MSRVRRSATYGWSVIRRSSSLFAGRSASSSRSGTRPTCATRTAIRTSRPGRSTEISSGAPASSRPTEGHVRRVQVRLEVLLPALRVDPLAEVPAVVERPDCDQGGRVSEAALHRSQPGAPRPRPR